MACSAALSLAIWFLVFETLVVFVAGTEERLAPRSTIVEVQPAVISPRCFTRCVLCVFAMHLHPWRVDFAKTACHILSRPLNNFVRDSLAWSFFVLRPLPAQVFWSHVELAPHAVSSCVPHSQAVAFAFLPRFRCVFTHMSNYGRFPHVLNRALSSHLLLCLVRGALVGDLCSHL